jgi:hypothetical protein
MLVYRGETMGLDEPVASLRLKRMFTSEALN